jgi:hypothetical protein
MILDVQKLVALPVAMALFIFAAQAAAGLTWRGGNVAAR